MSMAMTRTPCAAASIVADKPTGPWPNTVKVSPPRRPSRSSAPHAVPVPQAIAAPASKLSASCSGISVAAGTTM
jgi:hypothetical protein